MAYIIDKYGHQVESDLDAVEQKTIYPDATAQEHGLMSTEHVQRLEAVEREVVDEGEALTAFEIMMICQ